MDHILSRKLDRRIHNLIDTGVGLLQPAGSQGWSGSHDHFNKVFCLFNSDAFLVLVSLLGRVDSGILIKTRQDNDTLILFL